MKKLHSSIIWLSSLAFFISCSKNDENILDQTPCNYFQYTDLRLSVQEEFTSLPGRVSVFFKVENRDGAPVAGLESSDFVIYEKGRNDECFNKISSTESYAAINSKAQIFSYNTLLVLDLSGSVIENSLVELKEASKSFIDNVMDSTDEEAHQMGIWWFDGENELHLLSGFDYDVERLKSKIDGIDVTFSSDPSTDLYGAVIKSSRLASQIMSEYVAKDILAASSIVIFTDGTDQAARYSFKEALDAITNSTAAVSYYTIGLGDEIDQSVLEKLGKTGSIFAANKQELESKFSEAAERIFSSANSYYLFEYCTPKRDGSGMNELTIVANQGTKKGFLQTSFDATGFTSGCTQN